ncbi:Hypothetical predicted protein [Paramuricea clavata]|uniref:Uncharacterized protein n=1 Tax=Paramuricea clavata TaxID=317549 RepID=A0A7D9DKK5_PARCT|nr:Hypothetical predicted protein [Paramuricea clavata]
MERVSTILDEYSSEYSEIWGGDFRAEELDELDRLYPNYKEMEPEDMDSEIEILRRRMGTEESDEREDIQREIEYVSQLRRMKVWKNSETEAYLDATHNTLKEEVKTLVVLKRIAKAEVRRNNYSERINRLKEIIKNLGFNPNEPEKELEVEEEERRKEEPAKKEEEDRRKAAELERKRLAEAAEIERKKNAEAEIKRRLESLKDDKEKTEYWRKKLEEWEKEKSKPEEPKKSQPEKPKKSQPEELKKPRVKEPKKPEFKEPKKVDISEKSEEPAGPDTEWVDNTYNFEGLLFQVAEDSIPEDDQPIFSGDSTETMVKDVRKDLTRYERFKSWVEDNFGVVIAGIIISVAALLTAVIIQTRKLSSKAANFSNKGSGSDSQPRPLPDVANKLIKFISSNLWKIAIAVGIALYVYN